MSLPKTFVLMWIDAVAHADVPTSAKAVALAMATHADYGTGQHMRAGTARLAVMSGLGERRTRSMVKVLRDAGLIEWDRVPTAPGKARNYTLTLPATTQSSSAGHSKSFRVPVTVTGSRSGGNIVPPLVEQNETAAILSNNGGNFEHKRRQHSATHQGHTMARTARAKSDAADGRDVSRIQTHAYVNDEGTCATCALPERNQTHWGSR
jgi:hypothetical protein